MIEIKQAVVIAKKHVKELYAEDNIRDVRLEEIMKSEDGEHWLVTIGFSAKEPVKKSRKVMDPSDMLFGISPYERILKVVSVDAEKGVAEALKIRE